MKDEFEVAVAAAMNISFEPNTSTEEKIIDNTAPGKPVSSVRSYVL